MRTAHVVRPLPLVISLALALALLAVYTLGSTAGAPAAQPAPTIPAYLPMIVVAPTSIPAPPTATVPPGARPDLLSIAAAARPAPVWA